MKRRITIPAIIAICFAIASQCRADILFYKPGTSDRTFNMQNKETRETLFEAINNVTLDGVGVEMTLPTSTSFEWRIFNSNSGGAFGSEIYGTSTDFGGSGSAIYSTTLTSSVALTGGNYYILQLKNVSGSAQIMQRYDEGNQGLPFTTTDSNFSVLNGGASGVFANSILPSFSVTTTTATVPEPSTVLFLSLGSLGVVAYLSKKKQVA